MHFSAFVLMRIVSRKQALLETLLIRQEKPSSLVLFILFVEKLLP